ncbi:MAG: hypothetical protein WBM57_03725 [Woeseiaceae bacterium]|jgi:uncharacterized peroxidase-related enzyme
MSYIKTIPLDDATGEVREMYERQQGAWGYVPNYAKSFSHRPEVMERWGRLLAELQRPWDKRRLEMITFAAAHELRHTSCSLAHGNMLRPYFSNEDIRAIAEQRPIDSVTEAEQEMMRFSRQVARDASTVEAADVERLKAHGFTDAEVFDIAAVAAGRAFFTKVLDAVGSMPDAGFMSIDEDLRAPLTVGRPISAAEDEVIDSVSD